MGAPVEFGENWRIWGGPAEYETPSTVEPLDTSLPSLVKVATRIIKDVPLEKLAAATATRENIWRHKEAHPYVLVLLLVDHYGEECLTWHPELLQVRMIRDNINPSHSAWTKILACRVLFTSPLPWEEWQSFHWVALGLSGKSPNFGLLEEPELSHIIHAVSVMRAVHPDRVLGEELQKFIAAALKNESIIYAPYPVEFCQDELDDLKVKCTHCGAIHRDDGDCVCVTCEKEALKVVPHPYQAELDEIRSLWAKVKELPLEQAADHIPDTYPGNVVYRLMVCWDDTRDAQNALASQLLILRNP